MRAFSPQSSSDSLHNNTCSACVEALLCLIALQESAELPAVKKMLETAKKVLGYDLLQVRWLWLQGRGQSVAKAEGAEVALCWLAVLLACWHGSGQRARLHQP